MRVLLLQLDGKLPNIALMRIAAHHKELGHDVELRRISNPRSIETGFWDAHDLVYASLIFQWSRPLAERLKQVCPHAIIGGTGWDLSTTLESCGITTRRQDYSIYPRYQHSIGFTQRGCRLKCSFCVVPKIEGMVRHENTVASIWRGDPYPRNLCLLDNDFGGAAGWRTHLEQIRDGRFKVCFNQGINARLLSEELAEGIASCMYYDDDFKVKRIYTAWDNRKDEAILFRGLNWLVKYGVKPDQIMVYMLCGYWPGETHADRDYRRKKLRDFGCRPFPMAYTKTPELMGFQRWVIRRADIGKNAVSWEQFMGANYRPENIRKEPDFPLFSFVEYPYPEAGTIMVPGGLPDETVHAGALPAPAPAPSKSAIPDA